MKITKNQLRQIIKEEAMKLQKKTVLENRKKAIIREMRMLSENVTKEQILQIIQKHNKDFDEVEDELYDNYDLEIDVYDGHPSEKGVFNIFNSSGDVITSGQVESNEITSLNESIDEAFRDIFKSKATKEKEAQAKADKAAADKAASDKAAADKAAADKAAADKAAADKAEADRKVRAEKEDAWARKDLFENWLKKQSWFDFYDDDGETPINGLRKYGKVKDEISIKFNFNDDDITNFVKQQFLKFKEIAEKTNFLTRDGYEVEGLDFELAYFRNSYDDYYGEYITFEFDITDNYEFWQRFEGNIFFTGKENSFDPKQRELGMKIRKGELVAASEIDSKMMLNMGIKPGPLFGKIKKDFYDEHKGKGYVTPDEHKNNVEKFLKEKGYSQNIQESLRKIVREGFKDIFKSKATKEKEAQAKAEEEKRKASREKYDAEQKSKDEAWKNLSVEEKKKYFKELKKTSDKLFAQSGYNDANQEFHVAQQIGWAITNFEKDPENSSRPSGWEPKLNESIRKVVREGFRDIFKSKATKEKERLANRTPEEVERDEKAKQIKNLEHELRSVGARAMQAHNSGDYELSYKYDEKYEALEQKLNQLKNGEDLYENLAQKIVREGFLNLLKESAEIRENIYDDEHRELFNKIKQDLLTISWVNDGQVDMDHYELFGRDDSEDLKNAIEWGEISSESVVGAIKGFLENRYEDMGVNVNASGFSNSNKISVSISKDQDNGISFDIDNEL